MLEQDREHGWPPFRLSSYFLNWVAFGMALGIVVGLVTGVVSGAYYDRPDYDDECGAIEYGCLAGLLIGLMYGSVTGWTCSKVRLLFKGKSQVTPLTVLLWVVGPVIAAASTVEAVRIGDTHEFLSMPLLIFGLPFVMTIAAIIGEFILSESRLRLWESSGVDQLDIQNMPDTGWINDPISPKHCATAKGYDSPKLIIRWEDVPLLLNSLFPEPGGIFFWKTLPAFLSHLSGAQWHPVWLNMFTRRLDDFRFPDWPVVVVIRRPWAVRWHSHCIVVRGTTVCDMGDVDLAHYERRGWKAFVAFQSQGTGQLPFSSLSKIP